MSFDGLSAFLGATELFGSLTKAEWSSGEVDSLATALGALERSARPAGLRAQRGTALLLLAEEAACAQKKGDQRDHSGLGNDQNDFGVDLDCGKEKINFRRCQPGASSLADSGPGCPCHHTPHAVGSAFWDFLNVNFKAFSVEKQRHSE